jgi:hypothetical protein
MDPDVMLAIALLRIADGQREPGMDDGRRSDTDQR